MFMPVLSGLVVSVDAFFIGLSLGLQKKCKFFYLLAINVFLFVLCVVGFLVAGQIYELIPVDPDYIVGFLFITLGAWTILHYFISRRIRKNDGKVSGFGASRKTFVLVGLVMSLEAMIITMGITFIFLPSSTFLIPLTVALAHFGYSTLSFFLARTKFAKKIPAIVSHIVSGAALITYGLMAIFVEIGV